MKKYDVPFSIGSLYICSKCGKSFDDPERAEKLKSDLRAELKDLNGENANKKIRVIVSGCLNICEDGEQTFAYYPNKGPVEIYTTSDDYKESKKDILDLLKNKI